jgi:hypothetical protein
MGTRLAAAVVSAAVAVLVSAAPAHAARALAQLRDAAAQAGVPSLPDAPAVAAPVAAPPFQAGPRVSPDLSFTPGKICTIADSDFSELRYPEQIAYCKRHVTQAMKTEVAAHYGVPESEWGNYEFDHLIPLAIGGNSHVENLWPEPRGDDNSDGKDKLELDLYLKMKNGTITQAEAVRQIYAWFNTKGLPKLRAAMAARASAR